MVYEVISPLPTMSSEDFASALAQVSEQRRRKVLAFRYERGRMESLTAYLLLKKLLLENYGVGENPEFTIGEHGKPTIVGHEDIHFNISHCRCGVAVAVGDEPVGIDIERIPETTKDGLCEYVLNEEELQQLHDSADPCVEFARLWTRKEAVVKCLGTGITSGDQLKKLLTPALKARIRTEVNKEQGWALSVCSNNYHSKYTT